MDQLEIFLTNVQMQSQNNLSAIKDVFFDALIQFLHNGNCRRIRMPLPTETRS